MLQGGSAGGQYGVFAEPELLSPVPQRVDGASIAEVLHGSWRVAPPPVTVSSETLETLNARLQATGTGGLVWSRIRHSDLAETEAGASLHDAYRVHTLDALRHDARLKGALHVLETAGVQPVLAKGWSVARSYPSRGLRPFGDHDLFVAPGEFSAAETALAAYQGESLMVDLHMGVPAGRGDWASVQARTHEVELGERAVRVFAPEDQLGLLGPHLLFHGAWRPLWLCDIAVLVESLSGDFDWDYLCSRPKRQVDEVRVVVRLAHEVLGADIGRTPWADSNHRLPAWLPKATLAAWSDEHYSTTTSIMLTEARLRTVLRSLRLRWPNPIEVTHRWGMPYNALSRLPLQLWDATVRTARAVGGAPARLGGRKRLSES